MKYWDDLRSTHGFEGGTTAPQGIELVAKFYCEAINKLAKQNGSRQGAFYSFDDTTINNPYRIYIHNEEDGVLLGHVWWDAGMLEAIERLTQDEDLDIDEHIRVYIDVLDSAEEFLESL